MPGRRTILSHHVRPKKNFNIFLPLFDWLLGSKNISFSRMSLGWAVDRIKGEYGPRRVHPIACELPITLIDL